MSGNIIVRDLPNELIGKVDPQLLTRLNQLFEMVFQLQMNQQQQPLQAQAAVIRGLQLIGLLGPLGQNLVGLPAAPDPQLQNLPQGNGTVTNVSGSAGTNISVTVINPTTVPNINVSISATPTFTTVNAGAGGYLVSATKVVGTQGAAVADATGAGDVVAQLNAWLARARAHGLIAP